MITYRLATSEDNQQLIELTASSGMAGDIALRIERHPDFFSLLNMRGPSKVFVAMDDDTIIGSMCVSVQEVYVDKKIYSLHYIGDLKVATAYRNKGIGMGLCDSMANYGISIDSELAFLNIAKGNAKPFTFFKKLTNVPAFEYIGIFNIHQLIGKKRKAIDPRYHIEASAVTDEVLDHLNATYSRYELGPVITEARLKDTQLYTIRENNKLIATMCLVDTMNVKQNVVTRISLKMRYGLKLMNTYCNIAGFSKMPRLNEPVRMMYIKYLAVNNGDKQIIKCLLNHARNIVYEKSYSFVSIGLHEKDPLNTSMKGLLRFTFNSVGMLQSTANNIQLLEKVKQGIPFEDYSLV